MIEILSTGLSNAVQDRGRVGYLDAGVSRSGAMDAQALEIANRLIGNSPGAAGIEISVFPFRLKFHAACRFAVAGAKADVRLGDAALPGFWARQAAAGDTLRIGPPTQGARVLLAFAGGIDVPVVLGSRSTDLKSGWGGHCGRGLRRGDRLALLPGADPAEALPHLGHGYGADTSVLRPQPEGEVRVRILAGAEWDSFGEAGQSRLTGTSWLLGQDANRQGYRLQGPDLVPLEKRELFSHGIMPGTIQVPPNGQPIIQMAEANTCGGYAKIAHVIEADLWRLAQLRPGERLRFEPVGRQAAIQALALERREMEALSRSVHLLTGGRIGGLEPTVIPGQEPRHA